MYRVYINFIDRLNTRKLSVLLNEYMNYYCKLTMKGFKTLLESIGRNVNSWQVSDILT